MNKLDLGWGNPYFLLELLDKIYNSENTNTSILDMTYAPDWGDEQLLQHVKNITEQTTGIKYKHYLITNGATQAINTILRTWKKMYNHKNGVTSHLGYPYYPYMVKKSGLNHVTTDLNTYEADHKDIMIVDSPSNPLGEQLSRNFFTDTIWDAVYNNKIYNACPNTVPAHNVYVGSFSKLLGLTGARVGWIATNDVADYDSFLHESLMENATVSKPSQKLIIDILNNIDLNEFMKLGKNSLDQNREELQKLSSLLGSDVQEKGMFYCAKADSKMFELFNKANIRFVRMPFDGRDLIRLNIGQTSDILRKAVKAVKKVDRRKDV